MEIKNSVAIVTGASSGIGLATARLLTKKGAKVALVARSKGKLEKLSKELPGSFVVVCDMTKKDEVIDMVKKVREHFGNVDILVNNAGQGYDAPVEKINIDTFHEVFDLDVVGPVIAMQQVIPIMRKQGKGSIINVSSGTALMYLPSMAGYSSLKRALVGISLTAREELKNDHISVSVVFPYITDTDFEKNTIKDFVSEYEGDMSDIPPPDTAEHMAGEIVKGIQSGSAKIYAFEWMKKMG